MANSDGARHILILESDNGLVGISVDEVVKITLLDLQDMAHVDQKNTLSPIHATVKHKQQLIILADFERCFNQLENYE
jgi:purine-binding chemotaxis protein CheW